ncbi:hypothetical protein AB0T83_10120 [Fluviibacterium sp. DFM31]|uniref:Uncharacterized protein n=1 Tax=Meridianimarinicoccus marinus TaxID=3231483 RepID=A0ABV3L6C6_9RHOB
MADLFADTAPGLTSPAIDGIMVAPHDSNPLGHVSRAVYVGVGGDIRAELVSGAQLTFSAVPAGSMLPMRATKILSSGTTASSIVALW